MVRVRYSFSSRRTGHIEKIRKQREKYPKLLLKVVDTSDIILEILDARYITEMRNLDIEEMILGMGKKIIYVFNKCDMVDVEVMKKSAGLKSMKPYIFVSATERIGGKELRSRIKYMAKTIKKDEDNKYDRIQVGVIGYPNAGKSSIINMLIGKTSAPTGANAGFTKGLQKLKLTKEILLLDSPGVIPHSDYSDKTNVKTSMHVKVGARDWHKVKDAEIVVFNIMKGQEKMFREFYGLEKDDGAEELIEKVGKEKNFLKKGGGVDSDRASRAILKDWQAGKIK